MERQWTVGSAPSEGSSVLEEEVLPQSESARLKQQIVEGLSEMGRSSDGMSRVYLSLTLQNATLKSIDSIRDFRFLQKVDLSFNELTDLSALGALTNLTHLDVSHNKLTSLLDFRPSAKQLRFANFAHNQVEDLPSLSEYGCLKKLVLDYNKLRKLTGLSHCMSLEELSVAHNQIETIQNLGGLPLKKLNVAYNALVNECGDLRNLTKLREVSLEGNRLRLLHALRDHELLQTVNVARNEIVDVNELAHLRGLRFLRSVDLRGNKLQEVPDYRLTVLYLVPQLTVLDDCKALVEEKVAAQNCFAPSIEVRAANDHRVQTVYEFAQSHVVRDSTLQSAETPYPILLICGPVGSGAKELCGKLVEDFADFFGYAKLHTTLPPYVNVTEPRDDNEPSENDTDYQFVSQADFFALSKLGRFVCTYRVAEAYYGLSIETIDAVARDGLACAAHIEIEGVLSVKRSYFEPRIILVLPLNRTVHEQRLRNDQHTPYSDADIQHALTRTEMYLEYHRSHPGLFDMFVNTDDLVKAYYRLQQLVSDYLGLTVSGMTDRAEQRSEMEVQNNGNSRLTTAFTTDSHNTVP